MVKSEFDYVKNCMTEIHYTIHTVDNVCLGVSFKQVTSVDPFRCRVGSIFLRQRENVVELYSSEVKDLEGAMADVRLFIKRNFKSELD